MATVISQLSISADGFAAGPNQSVDDPIGEGGMRLHEWALNADPGSVDAAVRATIVEGIGAVVMGRKMFGGGDGDWDESWKGWWGDEPPYHAPVFVLTHHARAPLPMEGGTTFNFVTDGLESALAQARAVAGERVISIAGGASVVNQCLAAGLLDELYLHVVPIVLGEGERLFEGVGAPHLEIAETIASPAVTHIRYRVVH